MIKFKYIGIDRSTTPNIAVVHVSMLKRSHTINVNFEGTDKFSEAIAELAAKARAKMQESLEAETLKVMNGLYGSRCEPAGVGPVLDAKPVKQKDG